MVTVLFPGAPVGVPVIRLFAYVNPAGNPDTSIGLLSRIPTPSVLSAAVTGIGVIGSFLVTVVSLAVIVGAIVSRGVILAGVVTLGTSTAGLFGSVILPVPVFSTSGRSLFGTLPLPSLSIVTIIGFPSLPGISTLVSVGYIPPPGLCGVTVTLPVLES